MAKKNDFPSVLAFSRSLCPSDGRFYGTNWSERHEHSKSKALHLVAKAVRGTISNRLKDATVNDPAKLNAEMQKPNLQRVDSCALGPSQDTLRLEFSLKCLGRVVQPTACDHPGWQSRFAAVAQKYIDEHQFQELGRRYAHNIANGRFLWRNRLGADQIEVHVKRVCPGAEQEWTFNSYDHSLRDFDASDDVVSLGKEIAEALAGEDFLLLEINAYAQLGRAQEVFPSQELILDKEKTKGEKSKVLYQVDGVAAMHSQKIGNALRSIDTWYDGYEERASPGPIAVEPYGAVTSLGQAFRPSKRNFYNLFNKFVDEKLVDQPHEQHYVMGIIVRGGVFGESSKE